jgi:Transposase DDE domain
MNQPSFVEQFVQWFQPAQITRLAREVGWLVREGKINPFEFFVGLVFGQMSALELTLSAQASCYTEPVQRQAVDQRYNQPAVELFRREFLCSVERSLAQTPKPSLTLDLAKHFDAVQLFDSTSYDCPESLATLFPGCGGKASSANCKVFLRYEYLRGQFQPLALLPGNCPDQGLAARLPSLLKANELVLIDKGFFKMQTLQELDQQKTFFLMPLSRSVGLWLARPNQSPPIQFNLADELRRTQENVIEWPKVFLGSQNGLCVRLTAFRLTQASADRRRALLRRQCQTKGRQPTVVALELAGWLVLITNAPVDQLPTQVMSYLYRVRWQIELIFKQCKSVLRLNVTQARQNPYRVQCEIWARLIAAVVLFAWHSHLQAACSPKQEISFAQVARKFQQQGTRLAHLLIGQGQHLYDELRLWWRNLLKTTLKGRQRTRKTTWEWLQDTWLNLAPA